MVRVSLSLLPSPKSSKEGRKLRSRRVSLLPLLPFQSTAQHPTTLPSTRTTLRIRSLGPDTPLLESYDPHHSDQALSAGAAKLLGIEVPPMQIDSQAKYCELCRGEGGLFFRVRLPRGQVFQEKIWVSVFHKRVEKRRSRRGKERERRRFRRASASVFLTRLFSAFPSFSFGLTHVAGPRSWIVACYGIWRIDQYAFGRGDHVWDWEDVRFDGDFCVASMVA